MAKLQLRSGRINDSYKLASPSYGLNRALGGGFMSGRIHVLWGAKASGKSTMALHMVAEAQKMGKRCLWVDSEKTYNPIWAESCGVDIDDLLVAQEGANVAEDLLTLVLPEIEKKTVDVLVIDSLSSVLMKAFFEKPEANPMAIFSRSAKYVIIKLLNAIGPETQIILVSHASNHITSNGAYLTANIGSATEHWASTIIKLRQGNDKKNDFKLDGSRKIYWTVEKSKQSLYPVSGEYWFNAKDTSIDQLSEVVDAAIDLDIIDQAGAWFKYGAEKWQGKNGVLNALASDLDLRDEIANKILSIALVADDEELEDE